MATRIQAPPLQVRGGPPRPRQGAALLQSSEAEAAAACRAACRAALDVSTLTTPPQWPQKTYPGGPGSVVGPIRVRQRLTASTHEETRGWQSIEAPSCGGNEGEAACEQLQRVRVALAVKDQELASIKGKHAQLSGQLSEARQEVSDVEEICRIQVEQIQAVLAEKDRHLREVREQLMHAKKNLDDRKYAQEVEVARSAAETRLLNLQDLELQVTALRGQLVDARNAEQLAEDNAREAVAKNTESERALETLKRQLGAKFQECEERAKMSEEQVQLLRETVANNEYELVRMAQSRAAWDELEHLRTGLAEKDKQHGEQRAHVRGQLEELRRRREEEAAFARDEMEGLRRKLIDMEIEVATLRGLAIRQAESAREAKESASEAEDMRHQLVDEMRRHREEDAKHLRSELQFLRLKVTEQCVEIATVQEQLVRASNGYAVAVAKQVDLPQAEHNWQDDCGAALVNVGPLREENAFEGAQPAEMGLLEQAAYSRRQTDTDASAACIELAALGHGASGVEGSLSMQTALTEHLVPGQEPQHGAVGGEGCEQLGVEADEQDWTFHALSHQDWPQLKYEAQVCQEQVIEDGPLHGRIVRSEVHSYQEPLESEPSEAPAWLECEVMNWRQFLTTSSTLEHMPPAAD